MPDIRRRPPPMYEGVSLRGGSLPNSYRPFLEALLGDTNPPNPFAGLSDDFDGDALDPSWLFFNENLIADRSVANGELSVQITAGGTNGSFWYNDNDGILIYKTITGPVDMRARVRVRNSANTGNPDTAPARVGGIAAHDPNRPPNPGASYNYVHTGLGRVDNSVTTVVEAKTTDLSLSTYVPTQWPLVGIPLDGDLRIVRHAEDLQIFETYVRSSTLPLSSDEGWELTMRINRADNTEPARPDAVPLPDTLQWGIMVYTNLDAVDVRMFVEQVLFSRPS